MSCIRNTDLDGVYVRLLAVISQESPLLTRSRVFTITMGRLRRSKGPYYDGNDESQCRKLGKHPL